MSTETFPLRERLRAAVPSALKARDRRTVLVLRSTLAAIDNAEAVDLGDAADAARAGALEASPVGVGVAEVDRRELTDADVAAIVRSEMEERLAAAVAYEAAGRPERASELRAEADVLAEYVR